MKRTWIVLIVLVLLLSGCNQKSEEPEIVLIVNGEQIKADDLLDSIEEELDNGMFGLEELTATKEPVEFDTSGLSDDEYRIRSVFEGAMFTIEDPNSGEGIYSEDAMMCNIYDSLVLIGGYKKPIEDFNNSLLVEEISGISDIKLDYCYVPKHKHTVSMMLYGSIENSKYLMLVGDIELSQNSNIDWKAIEANNDTNAEEVATLYTEMDNIKLESYNLDGKTIYHFSGQEGYFLSKIICVKEYSTVYLWDYQDAICAVNIPGEHREENFEYCSFIREDI